MIGKKLHQLRNERKLTQEELADKLGLKKSSISRYESNQQVPELDMLKKISDLFGVSIDYLSSNDLIEELKSEEITSISSRLKVLRLSKKLSQKELSKALSIPPNTYNGYEIGRREPNFETIVKIAKYFSVSTDYLLGIDEDKKEPIEITLEDEVIALRIARNKLNTEKANYKKSDMSLKSYYSGKVDALCEVIENILDEI